jgi:Ca-activated chloride channel family protein
MRRFHELRSLGLPVALLVATTLGATGRQERPTGQGFSFKTGVDLVNVTATVTDASGRFVPGLRREDFIVYEDGKPQDVSQFDAERVPVSLGLALDTSGSMLGEKIAAAQAALNRFLVDLLGPQDEVFLYRFDSRPDLVQSWTVDRQAVIRALGLVQPRGGTAIYDTVAEAVPLAQAGTRKKKALLVISDGNDTSSKMRLPELRQLIRETEVLVYAIAIDASEGLSHARQTAPPPTSVSTGKPVPSPFPGKQSAAPPPPPPPPSRHAPSGGSTDRVNVEALREITDDTGGRTETIVSHRDLDPATAGIADELSKQYYLGYVSSLPKDGRWHTIDVQVRKGHFTVRARKGYVSGG